MSEFTFDLQRFDLTTTEQVTSGDNISVFSAKINGTTYYGTAEDFTTDNLSGVTEIKLLADITLSATVEISQTVDVDENITVTLDLNGNTISHTSTDDSAIAIQNNGSLTITDSETGGGGITSNGTAISNSGTLTVNGGEISGTLFGVYNDSDNGTGEENNPIVKVNGGTISGGHYDDLEEDEETTSIASFEGAGIYIGQGTLEVSTNSTAIIKGEPAAIVVSSDLASSGTDASNPIQILGGTLDGYLAIDENGDFSTIYKYLGGGIDLLSTVSSLYNFAGAKFTSEDYFPTGYGYTKTEDGKFIFTKTIATVNGTEYTSWDKFVSAVESASSEDENNPVEIKMLSSIKIPGPNGLQIIGDNVNLNLNDKTIFSEGDLSGSEVISVSGDNVSIFGGTIKGTDISGISITNGDCTVDNCTIDVTGSEASPAGIEAGENSSLKLNNSIVTVKGNNSEDTDDDSKIVAIRNSSNLTITGTTTIQAEGDNILGIKNKDANLEITKGTSVSVKGTGSTALSNAYTNLGVTDQQTTLTVSGGTISATGEGSTAIANENEGAVTVNDTASITAEGKGSTAVANRTDGTVSINGGTVTATGEDSAAIVNGTEDEESGSSTTGTVNITNGTISGEITVAGNSGSTDSGITITGGSFDTNVSKYLSEDSDLGIKITVDNDQKTYYGEGWHRQNESDTTSTTWVYVVKLGEDETSGTAGDTGKIAATVTNSSTRPLGSVEKIKP